MVHASRIAGGHLSRWSVRRAARGVVGAVVAVAMLVGAVGCGDGLEETDTSAPSPLLELLTEPCPDPRSPAASDDDSVTDYAVLEYTGLLVPWEPVDLAGMRFERGPLSIPAGATDEVRATLDHFRARLGPALAFVTSRELGEDPVVLSSADLAQLTEHLLPEYAAGSLPPGTEVFGWSIESGLAIGAWMVIAGDDATIVRDCDGSLDSLLGDFAGLSGVSRGDVARRLAAGDPTLAAELDAANPLAEPAPVGWADRPLNERNLVFPDRDMPGSVRASLISLDLVLENVPRGKAVDSGGDSVVFVSDQGWSGGADLGAADDRSGLLSASAVVVAPAGAVVRVGVGEPGVGFDAFTHEFVVPSVEDAARGLSMVVLVRFGDDGRIAGVELLDARETAARIPGYEVPPAE